MSLDKVHSFQLYQSVILKNPHKGLLFCLFCIFSSQSYEENTFTLKTSFKCLFTLLMGPLIQEMQATVDPSM